MIGSETAPGEREEAPAGKKKRRDESASRRKAAESQPVQDLSMAIESWAKDFDGGVKVISLLVLEHPFPGMAISAQRGSRVFYRHPPGEPASINFQRGSNFQQDEFFLLLNAREGTGDAICASASRGNEGSQSRKVLKN